MGGCCSCYKSSSEDGTLSNLGSPAKQKDYGSIKESVSPYKESTKETDLLIKTADSQDDKIEVAVKPPSSPLSATVMPTGLKDRSESVTISEKVTEQKQIQGTQLSVGTQSMDTPDEEESEDEEEEHFSEKDDDASLVATPTKEEPAEAPGNGDDHSKEKKKKGERKGLIKITSHSMGKATKKASAKMKKAWKKKEKGDKEKEKVADDQPAVTPQAKPAKTHKSAFERGHLERVSSDRMKSKYARERMEVMEKEREVKKHESTKHHSSGVRDPRQAAHERGQKLGELHDATDEMRQHAAGFAHTASQLAHRK